MNGILLVNKPKDMTSRDVVNILSKKFNTRKVGHTGTLDPIATGVLGIAINDGVKIVDFLMSDTKEYIATAKLGLSTDTLDVTGNVITTTEVPSINKEHLSEVLNTFLGKSIQEVPIYSALKVNGKRLYEYAREKKEVTLPKREIEIFDIELIELKEDTFSFRVKVSKGTYIRSLIRDIGLKLEIPCVMQELTRTKQGIFKLEESFTLEEIQEDNYKLISIKDALQEYKMVKVNDYIAEKISNGRILENRYENDIIVFIDEKDEVLAIYKVYERDSSKIKPIKVFCNFN